MKPPSHFAAVVISTIAAITFGSSVAMAEGIASEGKSLGGMSDNQCLNKVDRVIANESGSADNYIRTVRGNYTRKMVFTDGSVDFACFPNQVVIIVYFSDGSGNGAAERDLRNFLSNF